MPKIRINPVCALSFNREERTLMECHSTFLTTFKRSISFCFYSRAWDNDYESLALGNRSNCPPSLLAAEGIHSTRRLSVLTDRAQAWAAEENWEATDSRQLTVIVRLTWFKSLYITYILVLTQEENKAIDTTGLPVDPPNYTHCRVLSPETVGKCGQWVKW